MKENPWLIFCPECGKTICARCILLQQRIDEEMEACDYADMKYIRRQSRAKRLHLETYDHKYAGANDHSTLVMRLVL